MPDTRITTAARRNNDEERDEIMIWKEPRRAAYACEGAPMIPPLRRAAASNRSGEQPVVSGLAALTPRVEPVAVLSNIME
jgi:hypothetical protein